MKILITGGAGFVGSHLCDKYVDEDYEVTCLETGLLSNVYHLTSEKNFNVLRTDIRNPKELNSDIGYGNFDAIIHLAAQVRVDRAITSPSETWEVNVNGTLHLLDAARRHGVKKFLFASSSEVYGSAQYAPIDEKHPLGSTSIYGASKIAGDRLCHAYAETYGMDIGILRPFNIYGPRQTAGVISIFIKNAMKCIPPSIQGDGSQSRDYIYVDDVVSAYDTMLHAKNPGIVNFGSGVDTSVKDLAEAVLKAVGNPQLSPEYKDAPANTTKKLVADITKAKSLGWSPKYDLKTGIEKFIGWTCEDALP